MVRLLDAGGWLGLSADNLLMLSKLWWPLCMLVQKGFWLASMPCLGSDTLELLRSRRVMITMRTIRALTIAASTAMINASIIRTTKKSIPQRVDLFTATEEGKQLSI